MRLVALSDPGFDAFTTEQNFSMGANICPTTDEIGMPRAC